MKSFTLNDVQLTNDDRYLFAQGNWYRSHEKLGAHPIVCNGCSGFYFAVWAPGVKSVRVDGDFNGWGETQNYLEHKGSGIWEGFVGGAQAGELYKYLIETQDGTTFYKADPYAFSAECPPGTASRLLDVSKYEWSDAAYTKYRNNHDFLHEPLNIFECHLGSWKRQPSDEIIKEHANDTSTASDDEDTSNDEWQCQGRFLSYDELSERLVAYVKKNGIFSHRNYAHYGAPF